VNYITIDSNPVVTAGREANRHHYDAGIPKGKYEVFHGSLIVEKMDLQSQ